MTRGFGHIVEFSPESQWLRVRSPPVEGLDPTRGLTTEEEIWQWRYHPHLWSLLVEIWLTEYREGWSVCFPFHLCLVSILVFYLLTPLPLLLGGYSGSSHGISRWKTFSTTEPRFPITAPWLYLHDTRQMKPEGRSQGRDRRAEEGENNRVGEISFILLATFAAKVTLKCWIYTWDNADIVRNRGGNLDPRSNGVWNGCLDRCWNR